MEPTNHDARLYEEIEVEEALRFAGDGGTLDQNVLDEIALDERSGPVLHRDIGAIDATELDGITINRTKRRISPFVPIIKTPTYSENSGTHTGFAVEIEDPDSETGYKHVGNVSKNYLLLSNEEVRALAIEIAERSGLPFKESRIFWDGSRFAHVIDFVGADATEEVEGGDEVGLSLITRSSYDKSWRFECALMGKRMLCDNGALSGEFFARVSFKHRKGLKHREGAARQGRPEGVGVGDDGWKEIVREGMTLIERAPEDLRRFADALRRLKRQEMTDARLREVWGLYDQIGDSIKGQIMSRYVAHEEPSLFGLFNAGTWVFSHREKMTAADFANNDAFSTGLLRYALNVN